MGTVLTREQILAIEDRVIKWCDVPEWHTTEVPDAGVFVQGLSGTDRDLFDMAMIEQRQVGRGKMTAELNLSNLRSKLITRTAVDSDDPEVAKPIFTEADVVALGKKNGAALQRIYAMAQELSGLSPEDVEELTKDLGEAPSSDSGSDSLPTSGSQASQPASEPSVAESSPDGESTTPSSLSATVG